MLINIIKILHFEINAPFISCISKINGVKFDNAEDLDVVMPMNNLLEYSKNYRKTTGGLWNFYGDKSSGDTLTTDCKSFKCKTSITEKTPENNDTLTTAEVVIPLKHLSNFWKNLNIPLINCKVEIILARSKNFALADMTEASAGNNNNPPAIVPPTGLKFQIKDTKIYVPVVTLSKENDIKLLEQLKLGFKRTIK